MEENKLNLTPREEVHLQVLLLSERRRYIERLSNPKLPQFLRDSYMDDKSIIEGILNKLDISFED